MNLYDNDRIEKKIQELIKDPPTHKFSESGRKRLVSKLYDVDDEAKTIVTFHPFKEALRFVPVVALICMVVIGAMHLFMPNYPKVMNIAGTVKIYRANRNQWVFASKTGETLYKNDILKTFKDGQADLVVKNTYHIRLKKDTEIKLASPFSRVLPGNIGYKLDRGKVFAYYRKDERNKEFNITTHQADVSVIGTDFVVSAMPALQKTWVGVLDGSVKVSGKMDMTVRKKETAVFVKPGQKTVVRQGSGPEYPTRLMENELLEMEELYRIGSKPQVALLISTGPTRVRELLSLTPLYISSEREGILPELIERIAKDFSMAIKEGSEEKYRQNIGQFEQIVNQYPNKKYDVQFLLFIGAYYEYFDDHENALNTFRRVVTDYPESSLTGMAQCAIAIIYEEKLKDIEKAREAFQKILDDYPSSPEMHEAKAALKRLMK